MKNHLTLLTLCAATLLVAPVSLRAEDKPPGAGPKDGENPKAGPRDGENPKAGPRDGGGPRMSPEERLKNMTEKLGLTEEQVGKVKAIFAKNRPEMEKVRDLPPEERRTKMRELFKAEMEEIAAVLTPEQKEKFKEAMEKRREEGGPRPQGDREGGPKPERPAPKP